MIFQSGQQSHHSLLLGASLLAEAYALKNLIVQICRVDVNKYNAGEYSEVGQEVFRQDAESVFSLVFFSSGGIHISRLFELRRMANES